MTLKSINYPSLLSYKGSIIPSLFYFYSLNNEEINFSLNNIKNNLQYKEFWNIISPIENSRSLISTTKSFFIKEEEREQKLDNNKWGNIQQNDKAYLPSNSDTLILTGNIRFINNIIQPYSINNLEFEQFCKDYYTLYNEKISFDLLATRYFLNLVNCKLLWENDLGDIEILIKIKNNFYFFSNEDVSIIKQQNFNCFDICLIKSSPLKDKMQKIINHIIEVFSSNINLFIELIYGIKIAYGQQVYPSQEFDLKNKKLTTRPVVINGENKNQVVFSDQKIGNAIRTIDTWYNGDNSCSPIAIEPYGINQLNRLIHRKNKNSFYDYFMELEDYKNNLKHLDKKNNKEKFIHHYIISCLIRGGIFGAKIKDN